MKKGETPFIPYRHGKTSPDNVCMGKYKNTRYWGVWINGKLLAVMVYKKRAVQSKEALFPVGPSG